MIEMMELIRTLKLTGSTLISIATQRKMKNS